MMIYNLVLMCIFAVYLLFAAITIKSADIPLILSGMLGLYLLVCAYAAIGLFMSSITSYQVVAAMGTLAVLAVLNLVGDMWQDIDFVRDTLKDILALQERLVTIENIQKVVAEYYRIKVADLKSKSRARSVTRPRQVAMALAKELTNKSLPEIGRAFERDHTTVLNACREVPKFREKDSSIQEDWANLIRTLSA